MIPVKRWLKSFFALSASQANGMMLLLPLLFLLIVSEPLWRWWRIRHWKPNPHDAVVLDSLATSWRAYPDQDSLKWFTPFSKRAHATRPATFFAFDPNHATASELVRLGFEERLARRIENYRKKGGTFRRARDLLKIFGMDTAHYHLIEPYVNIPPKQYAAFPTSKARDTDGHFRKPGQSTAEEPFDINTADTVRLEALRGIGQKLSRRIIKYRSSLGGFVHVGQIREVFGLDSVVAEQLMKTAFVSPDFLPDRIDLNAADEKRLDAHPYLNRQDARAIVAWRFQHGRFESVSDLRKLPIFNVEKVRQIEPYLKTVE